jgi:hypothetical protein
MKATKRNITIRIEILIFALLWIGLGATWTVSSGKLSAFWNAIQPHNQQYTALSFNNPNSLPIIDPISNHIAFSFSVRNVTDLPITYSYVISAVTKSGTQTIVTKNVTVAPNEQVSVPADVEINRATDPSEIIVSLPNQNESIDFMLKESAA